MSVSSNQTHPSGPLGLPLEAQLLALVTSRLESAKNAADIVQGTLEAIQTVLPTPWLAVLRRESNRLKIVECAGTTPELLLEQGTRGFSRDTSTAWRAVSEGRAVSLDLSMTLCGIDEMAVLDGGLGCWPLRNSEGVVWGVLALTGQEINTDSATALGATLGAVALIVGGALERTRLIARFKDQAAELESRNVQATILTRVAGRMNERGDLLEQIGLVLEDVVQSLGLLGADLLERRGDALYGLVFAGTRDQDLREELLGPNQADGLLERLLQTRKPLYVYDLAELPGGDTLELFGVQSLAFIPVGSGTRRKTDWQGFLGLRFVTAKPGAWTTHAKRILEGAARIVAGAVERERRATLIDNQAKALNAFAAFAEAAAQETQADVLAKKTLEIIRATLGHGDAAYFRNIDGQWKPEFWYGDPLDIHQALDDGTNGPMFLLPEALEDLPMSGSSGLQDWMTQGSQSSREVMMYPIVLGKKVNSFFMVRLPPKERFEERDSAVVRAVGRGFTVAIQRAEAGFRLQQQQNLLEQERLFLQALLSSLSEGIVACDADGMITQFNEAAQGLYGLESGLTMYKPDGTTLLKWEETPLVRALGGEPVNDQELIIRPRGQSNRTLIASSNPIRDKDGTKLGAVMALHDISERKQAEERLKQLHIITAAPRYDFAEKMNRLLEMGCREFGLEVGALTRVDGMTCEIQHAFSTERFVATPVVVELRNTFCRDTVRSVTPLTISHASVTEWQHHPGYTVQHSEAYVGTPVRLTGEIFGTLNFTSRRPHETAFTDSDRDLLRLMAQWIGGELERQRAEEALKRQNAYLAALHETTISLMDRLEVDHLLEPIITRALELIGTNHGFVCLRDSKKSQFVLRSGMGMFEALEGTNWSSTKGLSGLVAKRNAPVNLENYQALDSKLTYTELAAARAAMGVPLRSGQNVIGVIGVASDDPDHRFSDSELELLSRFAEFASLALDNARLYAEAQQEIRERTRAERVIVESGRALERQYRRQAALSELEVAFDQPGELERLARHTATVATELLPGTLGAGLALIEDGKVISHCSTGLVLDLNALALRLVLQERQTIFAGDLEHHDAHLREGLPPEILAFAAVPLVVAGETLGVLYANELAPRKYAQDDKDFLINLAGRVAVLASKAMLYDRLVVSNKLLGERSGELEARNAEQETFVYTVSHDLRTPLLSIQGMATLLEEAVSNSDAEEASFLVGRITKNVGKMGDLLNDLLMLSRVGRSAESAETLDVGQTIDNVLSELEPRLKARNVTVQNASAWPSVVYPRSDLYQVLSNLIGNASKFAGRDGHGALVKLDRQELSNGVVVKVHDNGPGIRKEYRERVFGLFQKLDAGAEGTGVGLAIVKRIVERHNGKVWVEDSPLGGACFCIHIPTAGTSIEAAKP